MMTDRNDADVVAILVHRPDTAETSGLRRILCTRATRRRRCACCVASDALAALVRVVTIDAFMQRVARAFPSLGPELTLGEDDKGYWAQLRATAVAIQGREAILDLMESSYDFARR
jgi:hypothetical protein